MKLIPPERGVLPLVREAPEVAKELTRAAKRAGVTQTEAVRQIILRFVAQPVKLDRLPATPKGLTGHLGPVRLDAATVEAFREHAEAAEITVGEAVRRLVRRFLAKQAD